MAGSSFSSAYYDSGMEDNSMFQPQRPAQVVAPAPAVSTLPVITDNPALPAGIPYTPTSSIVERSLPPTQRPVQTVQQQSQARLAPVIPTNTVAGQDTGIVYNRNPFLGYVASNGLGGPQPLVGYSSRYPHVLYGGLMDTTYPFMTMVANTLAALRAAGINPQVTGGGGGGGRGAAVRSGGGGGAAAPRARAAAPASTPASSNFAQDYIMSRLPGAFNPVTDEDGFITGLSDGTWGPTVVERSVARGFADAPKYPSPFGGQQAASVAASMPQRPSPFGEQQAASVAAPAPQDDSLNLLSVEEAADTMGDYQVPFGDESSKLAAAVADADLNNIGSEVYMANGGLISQPENNMSGTSLTPEQQNTATQLLGLLAAGVGIGTADVIGSLRRLLGPAAAGLSDNAVVAAARRAVQHK